MVTRPTVRMTLLCEANGGSSDPIGANPDLLETAIVTISPERNFAYVVLNIGCVCGSPCASGAGPENLFYSDSESVVYHHYGCGGQLNVF